MVGQLFGNSSGYEQAGMLNQILATLGPAAAASLAGDALSRVMEQPVKPLVLSNCLSNAAQGHVAEQGPEGATGHYSANGASPSDRATRHLSGTAYCGENISYGMPTPRDVVIQFVVDDGVPTRGHRENLFKDDYKSVGFGFGPAQEIRVHGGGVDVHE
ncbi:CAP domain-containing protein [Ideonella azotifigens]|uniref:SCP domain-containing protein n=1 Tax=Ideonella azotifigens TaxID=513160 RepID=A0ABN1KK54_9BURK|nr:CAP domain-containing protein [Ideonella azotifigens]MCD2339290.1 CAP domain-containing protein [Ideonella azotifigens]